MAASLLIHVGATLALVGLIWFVQVVHYPLFARVGSGAFAAYESAHVSSTGYVTVPLMLAELITGVALVIAVPPGIPPEVPWAGLALLGVIWASTFLVQVPRHRRLENGFDARAHRELVRSNWLRTAGWSVRGVLVLWMAAAAA